MDDQRVSALASPESAALHKQLCKSVVQRCTTAGRGSALLGALLLARPREAVLVEPVDQRAARDAEQLGGLGLVAAGLLERGEDALHLAFALDRRAGPAQLALDLGDDRRAH